MPDGRHERVERLIDGWGFKAEYEPNWVTGLVPDYFCTGPFNMWVEVKSLEHDEYFESSGDAHVEMRKRLSGLVGQGRAFGTVGGQFDHKDAKVVTGLTKRALENISRAENPIRTIAIIPNDPVYSDSISFTMETNDGRVLVIACQSKSGVYDHPHDLEPAPYDQKTTVINKSGSEEVYVRNLITFHDHYRVAVDIMPNGRPFEYGNTMGTGFARTDDTPKRIRRALGGANKQFKNGCVYEDAPCLLIVEDNRIGMAEPLVLAGALYGNPTYTFSPDDFNDGELRLAEDGAWSGAENTTTSALLYIGPGTQSILIHNVNARLPLPERIIPALEYAIDESGNLLLI